MLCNIMVIMHLSQAGDFSGFKNGFQEPLSMVDGGSYDPDKAYKDSKLVWIILYCIVLCCIVLYFVVLYCTVVYCTAVFDFRT